MVSGNGRASSRSPVSGARRQAAGGAAGGRAQPALRVGPGRGGRGAGSRNPPGAGWRCSRRRHCGASDLENNEA